MKKSLLLLSVAFIILLGGNVSDVSATIQGCSDTTGFSTIDGSPCGGSTAQQTINIAPVPTCTSSGYDSTTGFKCGCTSVTGWSAVNGTSCAITTTSPVNTSPTCTSGYDTASGYKCGCTSSLGYSTTTGESCGSSSTSAFLRNLTIGSMGPDVKALQALLNSKGYIIAETGAGSPGNESAYFGVATAQALAKYQQAHNIVPASGYFGPRTRQSIGF
jgi:hypothetical protein